MAGKRIARTIVHTGDRLISDIQARSRENTDVLNTLAIPSDAKLIANISVGAGATFTVKHRLGRKYTGWALHRVRTGFPHIVETAQSSTLDRSQVSFTNSGGAAALVDILVY